MASVAVSGDEVKWLRAAPALVLDRVEREFAQFVQDYPTSPQAPEAS